MCEISCFHLFCCVRKSWCFLDTIYLKHSVQVYSKADDRMKFPVCRLFHAGRNTPSRANPQNLDFAPFAVTAPALCFSLAAQANAGDAAQRSNCVSDLSTISTLSTTNLQPANQACCKHPKRRHNDLPQSQNPLAACIPAYPITQCSCRFHNPLKRACIKPYNQST